jgi:hypothetical protein
VAYPGADYVSSDVSPTAIDIVDLGSGFVVWDDFECADKCEAAPGCNAASFYNRMPKSKWPGKKNCWLKTIAVPCVVPADAQIDNPWVTLLMKQTDRGGQTCTLSYTFDFRHAAKFLCRSHDMARYNCVSLFFLYPSL